MTALPSSSPLVKKIVKNIKPAKTGPPGVLMLSDLDGVEEEDNNMSESDRLSTCLLKAKLSMPQSRIPSSDTPDIGDSYSNKLSVSDTSPASIDDRQLKGNSKKLSHSIKSSVKIQLTQSNNDSSPEDSGNSMQFNYIQRISKAGANLGKSRNRLRHVRHALDPEKSQVSLTPECGASKFKPGRKPKSDNSIGRRDFRKKTLPKNLAPSPVQFQKMNSSDTVNNLTSLGQVMTPVNSHGTTNLQTTGINRLARFNSYSGGNEQQSLWNYTKSNKQSMSWLTELNH